jgi:hypothetical protein
MPFSININWIKDIKIVILSQIIILTIIYYFIKNNGIKLFLNIIVSSGILFLAQQNTNNQVTGGNDILTNNQLYDIIKSTNDININTTSNNSDIEFF